MTTLLAVEDVLVRFGGIVALGGVSFSLAKGELLGLIGPNGAGKTTMLHTVIGVVKPTEGRILVADRDVTRLAPDARARLGVALTHQIVRPFRGLSVLDNVTLAAGFAKTTHLARAIVSVSRTAERARARELLALVGIADYADAAPGVLPLGALKRLEVARALAISPAVLLLDEPLAGLNSVEAARLAATLADLNASGITMILIEHNLAKVAEICPRLVVLDNGRKIADGPTAAVLADPQVIAAYMGQDTSGREPGREAAHAGG
ncbi:ATP-binding cassette domain-containing protein [Rhodoplanes serenus]|uniref:ATP-binding cassette domain-containing protein n=1 Tax=Rhodoplanes serenus TaxID=200615 RepID=A0A9X4XLW1_9BRAD|nr:ABC transporter ATP-binding protein [Rhodoplanes serenus]MTW17603.1 ATP-binding cassette domain-containing protein [Rhodoplanes serenus]